MALRTICSIILNTKFKKLEKFLTCYMSIGLYDCVSLLPHSRELYHRLTRMFVHSVIQYHCYGPIWFFYDFSCFKVINCSMLKIITSSSIQLGRLQLCCYVSFFGLISQTPSELFSSFHPLV